MGDNTRNQRNKSVMGKDKIEEKLQTIIDQISRIEDDVKAIRSTNDELRASVDYAQNEIVTLKETVGKQQNEIQDLKTENQVLTQRLDSEKKRLDDLETYSRRQKT